MITKFKIFESAVIPKIGDYVRIYAGSFDRFVEEFINDKIGKIISIDANYDEDNDDEYPFEIEFDEIIPGYNNSIKVNRWEISDFLTPKEVKEYLLKKRYNKI